MTKPIEAMGRDELIQKIAATDSLTKAQWAALNQKAAAYKPKLRDSETKRHFARIDVSAKVSEGVGTKWTISAVYTSHGKGSTRHVAITADTLQEAYAGVLERLDQTYRKWE